MEEDKYAIKYGKYGAYFFDQHNDTDLTLEDVLKIMLEHHNKYNNIEMMPITSGSKWMCGENVGEIQMPPRGTAWPEVLMVEDVIYSSGY